MTAKKDSALVEDVKSALSIPEEMKGLYEESKNVGAANLGQSLPLLKVHYANQSKNELDDGSEPENGNFFHTETKQQFKEVDCHILSISRGYRSEKPAGMVKPGENSLQYQQLLSGILVEADLPTTPFMMFVKGLSLAPMWDFGKDARKYTKGKNPVPLFALRVKLTAVQEKSTAGNKVWVTHYEIVRNKDGQPLLLSDAGNFSFIKEKVKDVEEVMDSIVANKATETEIEAPVPAEEVDIDDFLQE